MWMEFRGKACVQKDSNLFKPTQTINRKHRFLPLTREKSMGMERNAYAWTFRGARCHLGQLFLQMGRLYAKKKRYLKIQVPKNQDTNLPRFSKLRNGIAPTLEPHRL